MTPLARWVLLLAALLARTRAVPAQRRPTVDACVGLCRADSTGSGFCDYRDLIRQFDERLGGPRALLRLCLTPCAVPGPGTEDLVFEPSELCRKLRISILEQRACRCDDPQDQNFYDLGSRSVFEEDLEWVEELVDEYSTALTSQYHPIDLVTVKLLASHGVKLENPRAEDRHDQVISDGKLTLSDKFYSAMKEEEEEGEVRNDIEGGNFVRAAGSMANLLDVNRQSGSTSSIPEVLETTLPDWDKWCMTQCSTGHGGSACSCDIIP